MISYGQPIVMFGKTYINLAHVQYARVQKDSNSVKWKMYVVFTDARQLWWSFSSEADAYDALDRFGALNETFMMSELP